MTQIFIHQPLPSHAPLIGHKQVQFGIKWLNQRLELITKPDQEESGDNKFDQDFKRIDDWMSL